MENKPKLSITLATETIDAVEEFMKENHIDSRSAALQMLVWKGLGSLGRKQGTQDKPKH